MLSSSAGLIAMVMANVLLWMPISIPAAIDSRRPMPASLGTPYPISRLTTFDGRWCSSASGTESRTANCPDTGGPATGDPGRSANLPSWPTPNWMS